MCTCCQNRSNFNGRSSCGCGCSTWNTASASSGWGCGCSSFSNGYWNRCISFPISGTAYVPVSAIRFIPNSCWNVQAGTSATSNSGTGGCVGTSNVTSSGCVGTSNVTSSGCGCFGRCGGAVAMANYNQDYYARQYGLND